MDKKKIVCILVIVVGIGIVSLLTHQEKQELSTYQQEDCFLYFLQEKQIEKEIGVDPTLLKQFHVAFSLLELENNGMILLEYEKNNKDEVRSSIQPFLNTLEKVEVEEYQDDSYYFCTYGKYAKKWMKEIQERVIT